MFLKALGRRFALLLLPALLLFAPLLLAGCESEPAPKTRTNTIKVLVPAAENAPESKKAIDLFLMSKEWHEARNRLDTVELHYAADQEYEQKITEVQPDVLIRNYINYADYRSKELLADLTPLVKQAGMNLADYYPEQLTRLLASDSELYGIPMGVNSPLVVGYSKTWFDQANLPYPKDGWTWEDYAETAKKLKAAHTNSLDDPIVSGAIIGPSPIIIEAMAMSRGGSFYAPDAKSTLGFLNGKPAVDSMQWIRELSTVQKATPPLNSPQSYYQPNMLGVQTGMMVFTLSRFEEMSKDPSIGPQIGVVGMPYFKGGKRIANPTNLLFAGIASTSKVPAAALSYIRTLTMDDTDVSRLAFAMQASISAPVAKAIGVDQDPFLAVRMNELKYTEPGAYMAIPRWYALVTDFLLNEITRLSVGNLDLEQGLTRLAETVDRRLTEAK